MILSLDTQRDIRNAALSALHYIAFDQKCEVADILALLGHEVPDLAETPSLTPSQPDPKQAAPSAATAPGADTSEASGITTSDPLRSEVAAREGAKSDASETPSPEPQPTSTPAVQAQNVEPTSEVLDGPSLSPPGAERAVDPAPIPSEGEEAGKSGEVAASPASPPRGRPETTRAQVVRVHHENPDWPSKLIAEHLSISEDAVRATASRKKLKLVSWWDYLRAEATKKAAGLIAPAKPETPPAVAVEPAIVAPAPAKRGTITDRLRAYLAEHPDATLREVSDALGVKQTSVGYAANKAEIVLRKYTAEERSAATSSGIQAKKVETKALAPVSSPFAPADLGDEPRRVKRPTTTRFYLREKLGDGQWLHMSCTGMTDKRIYAWIGTAQQLKAVRKTFSIADGLVEVVAQ